MFINMCKTHDLKVMNTMFKKQKDQIATFREIGTNIEEEKTRGTF